MQALIVEEPSSEPKESNPANLVTLKTQTTALRDQIYRLEREEEFKSGGGRRASGKSIPSTGDSRNLPHSKATEKPRKKLAEVEAQLLLASPGLVFQVREMSEIKGGRNEGKSGEKSFVYRVVHLLVDRVALRWYVLRDNNVLLLGIAKLLHKSKEDIC